MTATLAVVSPAAAGWVEDYAVHVAELAVNASSRSARTRAARLLTERADGDLASWMGRPTDARLAELHRLKAWPFLSWLLVEGHLDADLELLLAKPGGCELPRTWRDAHPKDVARATAAAADLGWSANWTRQIVGHALPVVCLAVARTFPALTETDLARLDTAVDAVAAATPSARGRFRHRLFAVAQLAYQAGVIDSPPRRHTARPARTAADLATDIRQPAIRTEVIRYARLLAATLRPQSVYGRIKAVMVLCDWLAVHHPDVARLDQLDRTRHIEPFLAWAATRPWRGTNRGDRTISASQHHHDVVELRVFFDDIDQWGWAAAPRRRLLFTTDIPRMPEPVPRALPPPIDAAIMAAVAGLDDVLVRTGLQLLRATGMRIGELLDLELDCTVDFGARGVWLRVPLGKLNTERMVPLEATTVAVLDDWMDQRGPQRALPHPRHGRDADFVFVEGGRRPTTFRFRKGLTDAVAAAGLTGAGGRPLHVTPHQLRHTFGTELVNGGISLPALMALLGHVTPEMTLRYAKLANPTIRSAYQTAIDRSRVGRTLPIAAVNRTPTVPDKVTWLEAEMLKTRLAAGYCARPLAAGPCGYANICEQCDNFQPAPEFAETLRDQLADVTALRADAEQRGWTDEATRHDRVADALDRHLRRTTT